MCGGGGQGHTKQGNLFFFPSFFFKKSFISPSSRCLHVLPDVVLGYILVTNYTHRVW